MFSFLRKETCPVQLYGKLPLAKDYLRLGCGERAGLALRDWLDRAFSGEVGAAGAPALAGRFDFVTGDALGQPLIGCLWPSSDAGGLRKFPFALLIERKRKSVAEDFTHGFGVAGAIWERLAELHSSHTLSADGQRFLAALRGLEIEADALTPKRSAGIAFDAWRRAMWPRDSEAELERALLRVRELASASSRNLRIPLVSGLPAREQAFAWARLLAALGTSPEALATLFFAADAEPGRPAFALFLRGALTAADARWLEAPMERPLGDGDLCDARERTLDPAHAAAESSTTLADSLLGAWHGLAARTRRA